jgi:hypothetical protein
MGAARFDGTRAKGAGPSSIVMAILLCRRIRIATRGCTAKAAPLTLEPLPPSGPDGKGQAKGQARDTRGEHS